MLSPGLLRAYRRTRYHVAGIDLRIDGRVPARLWQGLPARQAGLITAWNPLSRRMPAGWNRRAQCRLRQSLRRFITVPAHGVLGTWHEEHIAVSGDARVILRLARRFRQSAVVIIRPGSKARLVLLLRPVIPSSR